MMRAPLSHSSWTQTKEWRPYAIEVLQNLCQGVWNSLAISLVWLDCFYGATFREPVAMLLLIMKAYSEEFQYRGPFDDGFLMLLLLLSNRQIRFPLSAQEVIGQRARHSGSTVLYVQVDDTHLWAVDSDVSTSWFGPQRDIMVKKSTRWRVQTYCGRAF
jgi:hypothetical protein